VQKNFYLQESTTTHQSLNRNNQENPLNHENQGSDNVSVHTCLSVVPELVEGWLNNKNVKPPTTILFLFHFLHTYELMQLIMADIQFQHDLLLLLDRSDHREVSGT